MEETVTDRSFASFVAARFQLSRIDRWREMFFTALILVVTASPLVAPHPVSAATIIVNTTSDESPPVACSLRGAVNNSIQEKDTTDGLCTAGTGPDTIQFSVKGTIPLTAALPAITSNLTINGPSEPSGTAIAIDGCNQFRVLEVAPSGQLHLNDLTITRGHTGRQHGVLSGAGVYNQGLLTVTNCTFSDNTSELGAAGIFNDGGTLTISGSTFSGNISGASGGGIFNSAKLTLTNSTFSGNQAGTSGGGIYNGGSADAEIFFCTFVDNSAQDGTHLANGGMMSVGESIVVGPAGRSNCFAPGTKLHSHRIGDDGYNDSSDVSCGFRKTGNADNGDGVDPELDPAGLQNNGGPTETIAETSFPRLSYFVDQVPLSSCIDADGKPLKVDQRGFPRPGSGEDDCDIGAYSLQIIGGVIGPSCEDTCNSQKVSCVNPANTGVVPVAADEVSAVLAAQFAQHAEMQDQLDFCNSQFSDCESDCAAM
jgi:predicted outer membrane repeat protein